MVETIRLGDLMFGAAVSELADELEVPDVKSVVDVGSVELAGE